MLICATTWLNLENTMLGKQSQSPKTAGYIIPFIYEMARIGKFIACRLWLSSPRGGMSKWGMFANCFFLES